MKLKKHRDAGLAPLVADRDENGNMIAYSFSVTYRNGAAGPDVSTGHIRKRMEARRREVIEQFAERIAAGDVVVSEIVKAVKTAVREIKL